MFSGGLMADALGVYTISIAPDDGRSPPEFIGDIQADIQEVGVYLSTGQESSSNVLYVCLMKT
jgi:hypothetical protein